MNFLAHAAVARRHDDDPAFVLGAVLPDLLPMAGIRLTRDDVPAAVAAGWRSHHHADAAFHESMAFREGVHALRTDLRTTALATGPRRAVAHVGWELLLDDTVMGDRDTITAFRGFVKLVNEFGGITVKVPYAIHNNCCDHLNIEAATAGAIANAKNWAMTDNTIKTADNSKLTFTNSTGEANPKDVPYGEPK